MRFDYLRIVVADRGRANDHVRLSDILGNVAFTDLATHLLESICDGRTFEIGSRNSKTEIDEYFGDSRHTYATYANEVNVLYAAKHNLGGFGSLVFGLWFLVFAFKSCSSC